MGYWLLKSLFSWKVFGHSFKFVIDVAFGGAVDGFVEAGVFAEELPWGLGILILDPGFTKAMYLYLVSPVFLNMAQKYLFIFGVTW